MANQQHKPIAPPVTWFGSKSRLVKKIVGYFPEHQTFVDVFGGSGAVLLGKRPAKVEVYNDLNKKMVSLFRILSCPKKTSELKRLLEYTPYSRDEFNACRAQVDQTTNEIELARQMIVIQRQSHGGLGKQWSYCVDAPAAGYSASVRKFHAGIERLSDVSHRIRRAQIENLPWKQAIQRYDRPETLFYLDPPYVPDTRINGKYEHEMTIEEHMDMVDSLLDIEGKAVLSGYAHPVYEPLEAAGWKRIDIEVIATSSKTRTKRTECLWISPSCDRPKLTIEEPTQDNLTNRQAAAYRVHKARTEDSEAKIIEAIKILKRIGKKVTKAEVARMTGISRVQISRRYSHLFEGKAG
ncbi:DNA adenine methylase [Vibrio vulnificus]|uniref:DNA adenine methylase n=1 Tax=Vibrio vulnificus TaxID=672 RepID=UPI002FD41BDF